MVLIVAVASGSLGGCQLQVATQRYSVAAPDGFPLQAYKNFEWRFGKPHWEHPRGVLYYIQGSEDETVLNATGRLAGANAMGMDVVMMERRGVAADGSVDPEASLKGAAKDVRVADHLAVIRDDLDHRRPEGPVILMGTSEGGDVAAAVATLEPRLTHLVVMGSGGGMSQAEELRTLVQRNPAAYGIGGEAQLDTAFDDIRAHPQADTLWLGHPYRRWSSFLFDAPLDDLLSLQIPIFLVHGDADTSVPVESARVVRDAFVRAGKTNLNYLELQDVDHRFEHVPTGRHALPLIEIELVSWLADTGAMERSEGEQFVARAKKSHPEWFGDKAPPMKVR